MKGNSHVQKLKILGDNIITLLQSNEIIKIIHNSTHIRNELQKQQKIIDVRNILDFFRGINIINDERFFTYDKGHLAFVAFTNFDCHITPSTYEELCEIYGSLVNEKVKIDCQSGQRSYEYLATLQGELNERQLLYVYLNTISPIILILSIAVNIFEKNDEIFPSHSIKDVIIQYWSHSH
jgi:hypothetical protein